MVRSLTALLVWALMVGLFSLGAWAKEHQPDPTVNEPHTTEEAGPPESTTPLNDLDVTKPPPIPHEELYYYPFEKEFSVDAGLYSYFAPDGTLPIYGTAAFTYLWGSSNRFHWESGAAAVPTGEGHVWTTGRWNLSSTTRFRPFFDLGLGVRILSQNGLATFLALSHYFVIGGIGAEYSVSRHASLRSDLFGAVDAQGGSFFGWTFGMAYGL